MVEKPPLDPAFESLLHYIQESRSLDFRGYKRTSLRRRLSLRMENVGAETFEAYQEHLEAAPSELTPSGESVLRIPAGLQVCESTGCAPVSPSI